MSARPSHWTEELPAGHPWKSAPVVSIPEARHAALVECAEAAKAVIKETCLPSDLGKLAAALARLDEVENTKEEG